MAAPKFNRKEKEKQLMVVAEMWGQRMKYKEIAEAIKEEFGISLSIPQISYDVKKIKKRWFEATVDAYEARVMNEVKVLSEVEEMARERLSREGEGGAPLMNTIISCSGSRADLLGLKAPKKIDLEGNLNVKEEIVTVHKLQDILDNAKKEIALPEKKEVN